MIRIVFNNCMLFCVSIALAFHLVGCESKSVKTQQKKGHIYEIKPVASRKNLYFSGNIQPISEYAITSPVNAVIESMPVHFGQRIKKQDVIMRLSSDELQKQYSDTLTEYLKAKEAFHIATIKFTGTQSLSDAGLISKNNYLSEKSSLDSAHIAFMEVAGKLKNTLEKMELDNVKDLSALSLSEFEKVRQALSTNYQRIQLKAPAEGVLLYPSDTNDGSGSKPGKLNVGSAIKAGQVVAIVGDLSGISIEIDVPEVDIDKVYTGMPATIRGVAFGQTVLTGELVSIRAQAASSNGGGLPSFHAVVEVKSLTAEQQVWVKVGMSATISLTSESKQQLMVPIEAVSRDKDSNTVFVQQADGKVIKRAVVTGPVEMGKVIVLSGLTVGDKVYYE